MLERGGYAYLEDENLGLLRLWGTRTGLRVLDLGCGFATTTARLQRLGNEVTGVESSPRAAATAAGRIARVVEGDLLRPAEVLARLRGETFDVLVFADVLEHLPWPAETLAAFLPLLRRPGGHVIVSLPNVGLWSVRLAHLLGRWNYEDTGVLDRTHLRFFTERTARDLLASVGLRVVESTINPGIARPAVPVLKRLAFAGPSGPPQDPAALLKSRSYRAYVRAVHPLERAVATLWPGMLAFQMIFEAE